MTLRSVGPALMLCLLAAISRSVSAQVEEVVVTAHRHNHDAQVCANVAQPAAQRVASCTQALQQPVLGPAELAGYMDQYNRALLGNAKMVRDPRGNALGGPTYRGMLLDLRANALTILGQREAAIVDYDQSLELNRGDLVAFSSRSNLILDNAPERSVRIESDLDGDVRSVWAEGIKNYNDGVKLEAHGQFERAIAAYRNAVLLLPSFARAHVDLGRLLKDTDPDTSLVQLSDGIQLDPWIPGAAAFKARETLNLSRGHLGPALEDLDQVILRDDRDSVAYLDRGFVKEQQGSLESALADYSRSIEIAPSARAYFDRGNVYVQKDEPDRAVADFSAVLALDPRNLAALIGRADVNYAARRFVQSCDDYTRLIAAQPKNTDWFFRRGNVYFDMGNFAAAYRDYSTSLMLDPKQPDVLYNRAVTAEHMGSVKDAENDRRRARALTASQ
ncbi:MAG TPA: tetratricopeptide repeat protein [Steroidobacteraceae bacterium]